jgi:hypothetical protein
MTDHADLFAWLREHGYPGHGRPQQGHVAALEVGETGPAGLEDLLREYAAVDYYHEFFDYALTHRPVPAALWAEFVALRAQVGPGQEARWLELLPQFQHLAWRLREARAGESKGCPPEGGGAAIAPTPSGAGADDSQ